MGFNSGFKGLIIHNKLIIKNIFRENISNFFTTRTTVSPTVVSDLAQHVSWLTMRVRYNYIHHTVVNWTGNLQTNYLLCCSTPKTSRFHKWSHSVNLFSVWVGKWKTRVSPSVNSSGALTASGLLATQYGNCQVTSWQIVSRIHYDYGYK